MEGGGPVVIANAQGSRTTPSVVAFTKDGERLVGTVAKRQAVMNPEGTVFSAKRFIGRNFDEVAEETKIVPYKVIPGPNGAARFEIRDKTYAPEEISAAVLAKLVEDASAYLGEKITDAVITVPAYFNDPQRQATKDAGKIAGLNVLRVVNEPTAAALAYSLDKGKNDKCVVDYLAEEFKKQNGIDIREDRQALQRLYEAAEKAKCELSSTTQTQINLPFITADATGPRHLDLALNRAKFDQLTAHLVERCLDPVRQTIEDAKLSAKDIDEVILVGGSTRIPAVQDLVRKLTGDKDPNMSVNPDEVVALGAAVQAGIIKGEVEDVLLLDVTPLSLGVETMGGVMTKVVERNTTIPARRSEVFSTAEDNQPAVDIVVLQGERELARDNRTLGTFKLEGIRAAPRGVPQVEVTFDIDANGILNVSARDKDTGKEQKITISDSTNLDKGEVERMVEQARVHGEEDKSRRQEIDTLNQLDSTAYQVERALNDLGGKVPVHEKSRAEQLVVEAKDAVKNQAPLDRVRNLMGDLQQILSSLGALASRPQPDVESARGGGSESARDDVIDAEFEKK
jgi:molecular chaperone DnaK